MILQKYCEYIADNSNIEYSVSFEKLPPVSVAHKWVGAQQANGVMYGIPNDMNGILKYTDGQKKYIGEVGDGLFKWTGGCIRNGHLYGFSRTANSLLKVSLETEEITCVPLEQGYTKEHHYGGVCTKGGIVYQPPRDEDHILVWDLNMGTSRRIELISEADSKKFRYCGSILHPDGYVFFLPERGDRVIRLDIRSEEWEFIGDRLDAMVFDAKIAVDGNIYGYSAYCNGILKIDPITNHTEMVHQEISPGAYGTKLGVNGRLYSIPGDGRYVWELDVMTDSLRTIYDLDDLARAKYAGGVSLRNGDIYAVPATENRLLCLKPTEPYSEIPEELYQNYFSDCY